MPKFVKLVGGLPVVTNFVYYDKFVYVDNPIGTSGSGYDSTHTIFTLPSAQNYDGAVNTGPLEVFWNEASLDKDVHYTYQNSSSATTITLLVVIPQYSSIRFRMQII